ncbi:MAG: Oxidoreductase family, NAD-binding Rossmann fold [Verrucomicrobiales bacterium]|nr:Oxidoreductase family, NAD-binding Rossmann fold [Verrucomicrobiales bacterium]
MTAKKLTTALIGLMIAMASQAADLKVGIIGLDTSHVVAFTELLNDAGRKNHIPGAKVVAAFRGGSQDIESSRSRLDQYTKDLQDKFGVKIVPSIEELCNEVDAILLESVDGRPHLEQVRPVFKAGKPVFIDKPLAGTLKDAIEIVRLAKESKVPCFSASSYRFYDSLVEVKNTKVGEVRSVLSYGPAHLEEHHPDMYWYGVHPTEALYTILGTGCKTVARVHTTDTDVIVGSWSNGRTGTLIGLRTGATPNKVIVFGNKGVAEQKTSGDYAPLVREIVRFFQTGIAPVSLDETLEMFAFMEAADESKRQEGKPVALEDVLKKNGG